MIIKLNINNILILFFSLLAGMAACSSSPDIKTFKLKKIYRGISDAGIESGLKLDKQKTYRIYFRLDQPEECIKIVFMAYKSGIQRVYSQKPQAAFFIVEKIVDISKFHTAEKEILFSPLARNYDTDWRAKPELMICSIKTDPIKKLDIGLYRIRFSLLQAEQFNFLVSISSNKAAPQIINKPAGPIP